MQCYCSVLSLLLILSAILQHSWSRLSWNINSLGFQDPTLSRFISTSWTLWSPQTLKNGVHQGLTPRLFSFIYTPQVILSRLLTLYAIYMLMIPKYYNPIPDLLLFQVSFIQLPWLKPNLFFLPYLSISVNGKSILSVFQPKNLRIILDSYLSLSSHIQNGSKSCRFYLQFIPLVQPLLTTSITTPPDLSPYDLYPW